MLELKAGAFYRAAADLAEISAWVAASKDNPERPFNEANDLIPGDRDFLRSKLGNVRVHLATLGARLTELTVDEALIVINGQHVKWGTARSLVNDVRNTLRRELSLLTLLVLERKEQELYAPPKPHFGVDVAVKFQTDAAFELDEAAKCLALGRPTASVFHLMRVMEIAVGAVARCLSTRPHKASRAKLGFCAWQNLGWHRGEMAYYR